MTLLALVALAWAGWALALAAVFVLLRRNAVVADAEHELRGAATAIGLAVESIERGGAVGELGPVVRLELARMTAALGDLGGPAVASPSLEVERLAQVLGNVVANAAEHGVGAVDVLARRESGVVRLEVRNGERGGVGSAGARSPGRGRGLAIARRAARSLGGRIRMESADGVTRTVIELPAEPELPAGPELPTGPELLPARAEPPAEPELPAGPELPVEPKLPAEPERPAEPPAARPDDDAQRAA